ncbi:MAG: TetR family transcriptional regulator [Phenylobacterium zucineum]|nr:MAG: TetR family transcriptional regulator [Phenylobacterium zucineum]
MTTKISRGRGRPRRFDPEAAVAVAQALFHGRGYDGVNVADVTDALGINTPSFYAAFGSKAGLYERVLDHWARTGAIPLNEILRPDRPVADCLAALLEEAARRYVGEAAGAGCLVLEGVRCNDEAARAAAGAYALAAEDLIRAFVAARHPGQAQRVTDYVTTTMAGLSARAREGQGLERLLATARLAAEALPRVVPG